MVDGRSVKSCTMLAVEAEGAEVTTIEGLAQGGKLHPMQEAFQSCHGCGAASAPRHDHERRRLPSEKPAGRRASGSRWLEGNICRCTGYHNIVKAVLTCRDRMAQAKRRRVAHEHHDDNRAKAPSVSRCSVAKIAASSPARVATPTTSACPA